MSETKATKIPKDEFPNYDIFCMKQKTKLHGLALIVKSDLFPYTKQIENTQSKCILWVGFGSSINSLSFIVGSVYIPGESSKYADKNDYDIISEDIVYLHSIYRCPFILIGDFNSRTGSLNDFQMQNETKQFLNNQGILTDRFNCDKEVNTNGRNLIKLCNDLNFGIVNGRFGEDKNVGQLTCIKSVGHSTVDYAVVSTSLFPSISNFCVDTFDACLSDIHMPICLNVELPLACTTANHIVPENCEKIKFKSFWKNEKKSDFMQAFSDPNILQLSEKINRQCLWNTTQEDIDQFTTELVDIIMDPAKQVGLCKKIRDCKKPRKTPPKPWFNKACEQPRKIYFKAKNASRNNWKNKTVGEKRDCINYVKQKGKEYKRFIARRQKVFFMDLHKNLRSLKKKQPREYWGILKKAEIHVKKEPKVPISAFKTHFEKLGNSTKNSNSDFDPRKIPHALNEEINRDFTLEEVLENMKRLKNNKSEGVDFIKNEYIKNCPRSVIVLAVSLFSLVLKTGIVPTLWCIGLINPIYKQKGSSLDPKNYRGVTLLSCLGKLFISCVNTRLTMYVISRGIIGEEQAGFREGYSTFDHIFVFNELINLYLVDKKRLFCFFCGLQDRF
jgi:hypothetical protein